MTVAGTEARIRRTGGVVLLAIAPVVVVAVVLHPPHTVGVHSGMLDEVRAHRGAWIAAHLLFLVFTLLLIPAFLALASIVRATRPGLAIVAFVTGLAGAVGQTGFLGIDLAIWQMAASTADPGEMEALVRRIESSAAIGVPLYSLSLALVFAVVMLLYALVRSRVLPAALAILVAAGLGLGLGVSSERAVAVVGTLLAAPGVVWLGWRIARDPRGVGVGRLSAEA